MAGKAWHEILLDVFRRQDIRLITYVPDNVLRPLISGVQADPFFTVIGTAREEEAVGILSGAWMGGLRGILLMQTSGFATLPNVLASLPVACQIPVLMLISERGTMGDFQLAQAIVCRTMRPALVAMGIEHHALERLDEVEFIAERTIRQAVLTQAPAALILSPLLTGGKTL